jgi:hypothetical protein
MPSEKENQIFLCHASENKKQVEAVYRTLFSGLTWAVPHGIGLHYYLLEIVNQ